MGDSKDNDREATGYRGALQSYLQSIRQYKLLTNSGEYRLATQSKGGEEKARAQLVEANLRLVVKIAMEYRNGGIPVEDLISEGNIGLIEAAKRFDATRGVRFIHYAAWWVRKYMVAALQRQRTQSSAPTSQARGRRRELTDSGSRKRPQRQRILSLEEFVHGGSERDWLEKIADEGGVDPEQLVLEAQLREALRSILDKVPAQERMILESHYGLDGKPPRTLQQIGEVLGCTRERVRQHEMRALRRARRLLAARQIER